MTAQDGARPPGRLPPRVRIAPSPTGDPHVGTAYIALFNYVFARKYGGTFILRIEDTDQERYTAGSEAAIFEALRWLGLEWDEGPDVGGPHGPYRQSERLPLYRREIQKLVEKGEAYPCFCTKDRLDQLRREQIAAKQSTLGYDGKCRSLSPAEASARMAAGEAHVVRLRVPDDGETVFVDHLRGELRFENRLIDDQVLFKSDGFPTYHLANVVDDHHMGVTHVIRGEEWITSTPKHVLLYRAFGWDAPEFFHLGLLRNEDKSKLSKRKNPVSVFHYRDLGYLPETLLNFMACLGYSMGEDRERFTVDEMIAHFDWSRVSAGGPVFDQKKLEAFDGADIRAMSVDTLYDRLMERTLSRERMLPLLAQAQERVNRLDDFIPYLTFFFGGSLDYGPVLDKLKVKDRTPAEVATTLEAFAQDIERDAEARAFTATALDAFARGFCQRSGWKNKDLFMLLRIAITGRTASPSLFDTMALCGKDRCRLRLRDVVTLLRAQPG
ncbi:glutamate--tRNA ligase [Nannocystis bainbridge]|uniref:Glutamate--tRNA ligase n=1 Tax=Nannocystis bainbridge TaxID=2995303 RepID=A0ABT5E234_9BACT|nr:glutamate--tRNA ligase [Nannocystis bainbridge]MDC0719850.1 glutamate--tRNA ligase [Nannocystis bainbridge]